MTATRAPPRLVVALQGGMVEHHARHGAEQGLEPHGGPAADLLPLRLRVVVPVAARLQAAEILRLTRARAQDLSSRAKS